MTIYFHHVFLIQDPRSVSSTKRDVSDIPHTPCSQVRPGAENRLARSRVLRSRHVREFTTAGAGLGDEGCFADVPSTGYELLC